MRPALLAASTLVLASLAVFACSSEDSPATPTEEDAGGGGQRTPPDDDPPDNSSGGASSGGTSGGTSSGGSSSGGASDDGGSTSSSSSGGNPDFDGGSPIDGGAAGTLCLEGSVLESEDNNTEATADQLPSQSTSFCGRIADGADVDFATFTLPENATRLEMSYATTNGQAIQIDAFADGVQFPFNGTYEFKPGKPYLLKVSSKNGQTFDYRINVAITTP